MRWKSEKYIFKRRRNNYFIIYGVLTNFGNQKDTKPIKFLIKAILDIDVEDIKIYNSELLEENYFDKKNAVDFIARINDNNIVNIEINTNLSK